MSVFNLVQRLLVAHKEKQKAQNKYSNSLLWLPVDIVIHTNGEFVR
jgi:hypothetical protein